MAPVSTCAVMAFGTTGAEGAGTPEAGTDGRLEVTHTDSGGRGMSERLRVLRHRRALVGVAVIVALAGLIVASTGSAASQPEPAGAADGLMDPVWTPMGVSGAAQTLM